MATPSWPASDVMPVVHNAALPPFLSDAGSRIEHMFDEVQEAGDRLARLLDDLDPDRFTGPRARELWGAFDRIERLGAAGKTLLARRIAATHGRSGSADRSAADELARRGGTSSKTARDSVDTSSRLPNQPQIDAALRRGELSPAQADLISGAAAANPDEEQRLLEVAQHSSLPELRDECLRVKANADPDAEATHRRIHQHRCLRRYTDAEGAWNLHARGTAECGAALNTVLDPIINQIFGAARRKGRHEAPEAYAFDALITMAKHAADSDNPATAPGHGSAETDQANPPDSADTAGPESATRDHTVDPEDVAGADTAGPESAARGDSSAGPDMADADSTATGLPFTTTQVDLDMVDEDVDGNSNDTASTFDAVDREAGAPDSAGESPTSRRSRPRSNPRYLALLRLDVDALRRGAVHDQELCEIAGIGPIPVTVARDLLGDAIIKLIITRGVDVLNVTHLGRGPSAAQRAALLWRNPSCTVQGCSRTRIEFDHRDPWANTHHTRLDELDPLCKFHHDQKTHLGYALIPGTGKRPIVPPNDPRHPKAPNTGPARSRAGP
jgi:Domain of unknown function (DUF222)